MRKPLLLVALLASAAFAGETYLGTIAVTDGGTVSNANTATSFRVPNPAPISIQAVTACYVGVNSGAVDAGTGVLLAAGQFFTSSTATTACRTTLADGGSYVGGCVAIAPVAGSSSAQVNAFSRQGNE